MAFVLGLFAAPAAHALDPHKAVTQYVLDHWGTVQGLDARIIRSIAQTSDGYLWLATESGLVRFDGFNFTVFNHTNTPAFASDDVRRVSVGLHDDLWISTYGGGMLHMQDGKFTHYGKRDGLGDDVVRCAYQARNGDVWICTASGLTRMRDGRFITYTQKDGLLNNLIYNVVEDKQGRMWIGVLGGLSRLAGGHFVNYRASHELPAGTAFVYGLYAAADGSVWAGTYGGGLVHIERGRVTAYGRADGLADDRLGGLVMDGDGNLWVATYAGGLQRFRDGRFDTLTLPGENNNLVLCASADRQGDVWFGVAGNGLYRLTDGAFTTFGAGEGMSDSKAYTVLARADGDLWIGTEGGGMDRFSDGRFTTFTTRDGLSSDNVVSLAEDGRGGLWIGTFGGGLDRLSDGRFKSWTTAGGLPGNQVFALQPDGSGGLWVGTVNGLAHFADGHFRVYRKRDGLGADVVRALLRDRNGRLWIGTDGGGLSQLDGGRFRKWTQKDGLGSDFVYALYEDRDDTLWIGTKGGGLSRLRNGHLHTFTTRDGLWDDSVYGITEDAQGNLWVTCPQGVYRVAKSDLDAVAEGRLARAPIRHFDRHDGLRGGNAVGGSQPALARAPDGRLWFATFDGISVVDPANLRPTPGPPPVKLSSAKVDGQPMDLVDGALANDATLAPGKDSVEFDYTAIDLRDADSVRFRYRLLGLDMDWVDAGRRRVANYANLAPDDYVFQVAASRSDGVWSRVPTEFRFTLRPYFYQTWWFALLLGAAVLALALAGYRLRIRSLKARERELSRLVAQRTQELAQAKQRFEKLSYTDELTGLHNRRYFDERLRSEWSRAVRSGHMLAAIMLDVDDFKRFNDKHGHHAGDACLRRVAQILREVVRQGEIAARYGGDEFVMLLPQTDADGAGRVAERIRQALEPVGAKLEGAERNAGATISVGAGALVPGSGESAESLLALADEALYEAKRGGRNRIVVRDGDSGEATDRAALNCGHRG